MTARFTLSLHSAAPEVTATLAAQLGRHLVAGDVVLLSGPVGAGKSHFARALIQSRLAEMGRREDVPSPTFTLVQSYDLGAIEIWHADLYRLSGPDEVWELGLEQAFEEAICLVEWPERLGDAVPPGALHLSLRDSASPDARDLVFSSNDPRWRATLASLSSTQGCEAPRDEP